MVNSKRWHRELVAQGLEELPDFQLEIPELVGAVFAEPAAFTINEDSWPAVLQELLPAVPGLVENSPSIENNFDGLNNSPSIDDDNSPSVDNVSVALDMKLLFHTNNSTGEHSLVGFVPTKRARYN